MPLSFNNRTVAGQVYGDILFGDEPMPWMMLPVRTIAVVWDRHGRKSTVKTIEKVVIVGKENVRLYRPKITQGTEILAMGQGIQSTYIMGDAIKLHGVVTLASQLQLSGE